MAKRIDRCFRKLNVRSLPLSFAADDIAGDDQGLLSGRFGNFKLAQACLNGVRDIQRIVACRKKAAF